MKKAILAHLKRGGEVSGEALGRAAGISRSAVWKHVKELRREGYVICSTPRRGYSLVSAPDFLLPEEIGAGLVTRVLGRSVIYCPEVQSTQDYAKKMAAEGAAEGTVVIAERQSEGRGRMGRAWSSPGGGVYVSLILRPALRPAEATKIPLVAGVAVAGALEESTHLSPRLKWPNDVLIKGKKVAGILAEMGAEMDRLEWIVVGIGINVNTEQADFPEELANSATSLKAEGGRTFERVKILQGILAELERCYDEFQHTGFEPFRRRWKEMSDMIGAEVTVTRGDECEEGVAVDIDEGGGLILENGDGRFQKILSGDVSVRKTRHD